MVNPFSSNDTTLYRVGFLRSDFSFSVSKFEADTADGICEDGGG